MRGATRAQGAMRSRARGGFRTPGPVPGRVRLAALAAAALLAAGPAAALEGLVLSPGEGPSEPTLEERADAVKAQREALQEEIEALRDRSQRLGEKEGELRREAEAAEEAARRTCPALVRIKYPWISCTTNAWGGKELHVPGSAPAGGVQPQLGLEDS